MPKAKQDKYIDLNQFPHKKNKISWKDAIGKEFIFYYNNIPHSLRIVKKVKNDYYEIIVDNIHIFNNAHVSKIKNLSFFNLFYEPNYRYKVGQIVNNCTILKCFSDKRYKAFEKNYLCKCSIDGYEFEITEYSLMCGHGCSVCCGKIVVKGINDIATTDPNVVKYFSNIEDAYTHTRQSKDYVDVICPICGLTKKMIIRDLVNSGKISCDVCSDGVSYPNKFVHELFHQLQKQYSYYEYEYKPDWAGLYRYDNYVELLNGDRIIIEMDGNFHNISQETMQNDKEKDNLAYEHNIKIIRIDCNYNNIDKRFITIKNNVVVKLSNYFDFSNIDWDLCNQKSIENKIIVVVNECINNPKIKLQAIAKNNCISVYTLYRYLRIGESLGLCEYKKVCNGRTMNYKPIAMYDLLSGNLIGIFKNPRQIEELFSDKNLKAGGIKSSMSRNKNIYKGYYFRFATYEEYLSN